MSVVEPMWEMATELDGTCAMLRGVVLPFESFLGLHRIPEGSRFCDSLFWWHCSH